MATSIYDERPPTSSEARSLSELFAVCQSGTYGRHRLLSTAVLDPKQIRAIITSGRSSDSFLPGGF